MRALPIPCQRSLFEIPEEVCYLNCAYMSPQLASVSRAGREAVGLKAEPWRIGEEQWFGRVEEARASFAALVGATADDIALVPSASYGIGTAARNCPLAAGQSVVLLAEQFPSAVHPWTRRCRETGARIVTVRRPADHDWTSAVLEAIDASCGAVSLPAFHWADGGRVDLEAVGEAARAVGARLVVDLSQSAGACPFDVAAVDPDWLCAPTYKWLMGPYSMGFLYVAPRGHDGVPLEEGWLVRRGSDDFSRLADYQERYREGARRYDVGERSNFVLLPMVNAALAQLREWGVERIAATLRATTARIAEIAGEAGFGTAPEKRRAPHFLGLGRPGGLPPDLVARLRERSVHVGARGDVLRVSPHLHVSEADLERFAGTLGELAGPG